MSGPLKHIFWYGSNFLDSGDSMIDTDTFRTRLPFLRGLESRKLLYDLTTLLNC